MAKRTIDIFFAIAGMIILSPLIFYVALRVRFSSRGPVLYSQERVGLHGKIFMIRKFRSMFVDSELQGPMLSYGNDPRVTPWGRRMRRYKLDELPQLWNVLTGEMSIVGPRPERAYYFDQLEKMTSMRELLEVRPGLTSLGMVKFGYAGSISQMVSRRQYDLDYLSRYSLRLDFWIMLATVRIIFQGKNR